MSGCGRRRLQTATAQPGSEDTLGRRLLGRPHARPSPADLANRQIRMQVFRADPERLLLPGARPQGPVRVGTIHVIGNNSTKRRVPGAFWVFLEGDDVSADVCVPFGSPQRTSLWTPRPPTPSSSCLRTTGGLGSPTNGRTRQTTPSVLTGPPVSWPTVASPGEDTPGW